MARCSILICISLECVNNEQATHGENVQLVDAEKQQPLIGKFF